MILWLAVLAAPALAQPPNTCPAPDAPIDASARITRLIPDDVGLVVVVNEAAQQRATPAGRQLAEMLSSSGLVPGEANRAWDELSRTLGWTPGSAFDALLGRRAMLLVRWAPSEPHHGKGGEAEWALISDLDEDAARRVRTRLAPAPRQIIAGLQVLAIDQGRLQAVVAPRLTASRDQAVAEATSGGADRAGAPPAGSVPGAGVGAGARLLLAPAGSETLFDQLLPVINGQEADAWGAVPMASALPGPQSFVLLRTDRRPATDGRASPGFVALTVACASDGWDARLVALPGAMDLQTDATGDWSLESLDRLAPGALVAMLGSIRTGQIHALSREGWLGRVWPEFVELGASLTGLRGLIVREATIEADRPVSLAMSVASQAIDVEAFRPLGDRASAALVLRLQGAGVDGSKIEAIDLDRGFEAIVTPSDIRDVVLMDAAGLKDPADATAWPWSASWFGERPVLSWGYALNRDAPGGWWVTSLGPARSSDVERLRSVLCCGPVAADGHRRVFTGLVRPARLLQVLRAMDRAETPMDRADGSIVREWSWLAAVDLVSLDLWSAGPERQGALGLVEGQARIRMTRPGSEPARDVPPAVFRRQ
jgi:hypothetical protein